MCAIKVVCSNRIVDDSIDSRMTSRIAFTELNNALTRCGNLARCILHTDRVSQSRSRKLVHSLDRHHVAGAVGRVEATGENSAMESFFIL